jgi:hypothetical protein
VKRKIGVDPISVIEYPTASSMKQTRRVRLLFEWEETIFFPDI